MAGVSVRMPRSVIIAGTRALGLTLRYSGERCSVDLKSMRTVE
jgi:hypothetical protein